MTLAALYDIHGNLPALEAVLDAAWAEGVDRLVVGGDVLPGPMAGACLSLLETCGLPYVALRGNGDNDVLATRAGRTVERVPEAVRPVLEWAAADLAPDHAAAIESWPLVLAQSVPGLGEVLFCHATPRDDNEIFTERTDAGRVAPAFAGVGADVVVCGHTHMPFDREIAGIRVLNAGSVGMPFGDTHAQWLLLDPDGARAMRTPYDLADARARMDAAGFPMPMDPAAPPAREAMLATFETVAMGGDGERTP